MAGRSFAFAGNAPARLHFAWPVASSQARLRNPRYRWVPPPPPPTAQGVLRGGRYVVPFTPFPGFLPPQNVRAGLAGSAWRAAAATAPLITVGWRASLTATVPLAAPTRAALPQVLTARIPWGNAQRGGRMARLVWDTTPPFGADRTLLWRRCPSAGMSGASVWRGSEHRALDLRFRFVRAWVRTGALRSGWREAERRFSTCLLPYARALEQGLLVRVPWGSAQTRSGLSWPWPVWPPLPPIPPRQGLRFHFHGPVATPLHFAFGRAPAWVIPIRRVYRVLHEIEIVRLPDRAVLPVRSLTLHSAWDEWSWSVSLQLLSPALELLRPIVYEAVTIEVTVNGYSWQFRLDQVSGSAQFAQISGQTQGRGRAALLGPEVALPVNGYETAAKTARQLAEQELTGTNWQLAWPEDFPDWLVPEETFSYIQKTPIEVISQIVATAGGRILADATLDWIQIAPRYPVPVWEWWETEPDLILPRAILTTLGWKPRLGQPWDAVYLGDGASVLAKVKRTGLPGASPPDSPTIEPLLCHLDACRARGMAILSDAAAGVDFALTLPLSSAGGISPLRSVGELVRFEDGGTFWIGLITAVSVQVGFGTVAQTLEVRAVEMPT